MLFKISNEILIEKMASRGDMQAILTDGGVRVFIFQNVIDFSKRG